MFESRLTLRFASVSHAVALVTLCLVLSATALGQASVASVAFKGSRDLREQTEKTAASIDKYVKQLDKTDVAIDRLIGSDRNLGSRYKHFASELRSLEKAQNKAGSEIEKLRSIGTKYFTTWDKANLAITDPMLREASAIRRSDLMAKYRLISDRISETSLELPELIARIRDLNVFLGTDLTEENVRRAETTIQTCRTEVRELRQRVNGLQKMLNDIKANAPRS